MLREAVVSSVFDQEARGTQRFKKTLSVAMALLASALVLAIFASVAARPAEARGNKTCSVSPLCAAVGWFYPRGERAVVTDNRTDGYGAVMRFEYYSPNGLRGQRGFIVDTKNNNHGTVRDLSIPEGWNFGFYVCLWKDGNTIPGTCSRGKVVKT